MNGPSARALREGGIGGSLSYKKGTTLLVRLEGGGPPPAEWRKKTTLQGTFGEFGQILRIDIQEAQGAAYVEYDEKEDAEDALRALVGGKIAGRPVHIQMAHTPQQMSVAARSLVVEEKIATMARSYRLDEAATARLVSVFAERGRLGCDLEKDCQEMSEHLAASNKPSALVSMKLADLRAGRPIGPCRYKGQAPTPGPLALRLDRPEGGRADEASASRSRRDRGQSRGGSCDEARSRGDKAERPEPRHGRSRDRAALNGKVNVASSSGSRGASKKRGRRKSAGRGSRSRSRRRADKAVKRRKSSLSRGRSAKAASKRKRKSSAQKRKASSSGAASSPPRRGSSSSSGPPAKKKEKGKEKEPKPKSKRSASSGSSSSRGKGGKKHKAKK